MEPVTIDDVKAALPEKVTNKVTQQLVDTLNTIRQDPDELDTIRKNFITYGSVMQTGKYSMEEYLNAVIFTSYKMMGLKAQAAYKRTFPSKCSQLTDEQIIVKATAYNRNKLVTTISSQSYIPVWLLNQDAFQEAVNTQVELMRTARSERVRQLAADSLMSHLARPDEAPDSISIDISQSSGLKDLTSSIQRLVEQQRNMIMQGTSVKQVIEQSIIDVDPEDVTDVSG